jgi:hypothetical protein
MTRFRACTAALLCATLVPAAAQAAPAHHASPRAHAADALTGAAWVRVDPAHPSILLAGVFGLDLALHGWWAQLAESLVVAGR